MLDNDAAAVTTVVALPASTSSQPRINEASDSTFALFDVPSHLQTTALSRSASAASTVI
jgi:hypothetical protein